MAASQTAIAGVLLLVHAGLSPFCTVPGGSLKTAEVVLNPTPEGSYLFYHQTQ
jgi:hypothetical protein